MVGRRATLLTRVADDWIDVIVGLSILGEVDTRLPFYQC